ncbi:ECF RNA polymerase sigma-E factor [Rubripirellula amarantea]|uniref:ECF RNA polymerase sigma-E factor n=1 Tax=Rubripirellula amarantea TaxID=2527999 RepID=A0A5C5WVW8_9BACT|nr:RNA polymerase sigma factor [Rubripirellula amarantea]TWT54281.1 ECF RNA polymerase sigma-E factor [Rubripirellula amarantea]
MKATSPARDLPPICEGDAPWQHPLQACFEEFRGELLGTIYYTVGNRDDARDVMQEAFLKCWNHRDQLDGVENLRAWVFRIAINTARDARKTAWNRRRRSIDQATSFTQTGDIAERTAIEQEQLELLRHAIAGLSSEQRDVFLLRQNGQMTYEQIANAISVPVGTVKTRMRAALANLRASVESES